MSDNNNRFKSLIVNNTETSYRYIFCIDECKHKGVFDTLDGAETVIDNILHKSKYNKEMCSCKTCENFEDCTERHKDRDLITDCDVYWGDSESVQRLIYYNQQINSILEVNIDSDFTINDYGHESIMDIILDMYEGVNSPLDELLSNNHLNLKKYLDSSKYLKYLMYEYSSISRRLYNSKIVNICDIKGDNTFLNNIESELDAYIESKDLDPLFDTYEILNNKIEFLEKKLQLLCPKIFDKSSLSSISSSFLELLNTPNMIISVYFLNSDYVEYSISYNSEYLKDKEVNSSFDLLRYLQESDGYKDFYDLIEKS